MDASEKFAALERKSRVLQSIAARYSKDSTEAEALKEAALALAFATIQRADEFAQYAADVEKPLSEQEEANLRALGLPPSKNGS